ncbi:MAG: cytidylate kinase family protein [Porphyromonadaceae bacterium]|nr:cytidylate kinase family protein [Porphyromonadaceae bacterium]
MGDIVPYNRMGEGLGMYGLSMALSTAIAPALGLSVMNLLGFRPLFAVAALAALIALFIGISIKNRNYSLSVQPLKLGELFERMSVPASITQFFFMMAYGVIEVYVAIYAAQNGLPGGGIYFICIAVATVLTRILLGRAIDKYGESLLVYTGNIAIIAGILFLVFIHNIPCYILSALLLGYSFGAIQPSLQTMAMHAVAPERRGAANSTFFVAFDLGIALGGFIAGVLIKYFGYDNMFLLMIVSCLFSCGYYYFFGRNHASSFNPKARKMQDAGEVSGREYSGETPLIVTISREYGSGGRRIGELLAKKLGVSLYDKKLISLTAEESGFNEQLIEAEEQSVDKLMVFDNPVQTKMFKIQSRIILDIAAKGPCVIVGRLANFILQGKARCFNIFVYADESYCKRRIITEYGVPESEAEAVMHRIDRERSEHCLHYTGNRWGDYRHYHLMVDSSLLGDEAAAEIIYTAIQGRVVR